MIIRDQYLLFLYISWFSTKFVVFSTCAHGKDVKNAASLPLPSLLLPASAARYAAAPAPGEAQ